VALAAAYYGAAKVGHTLRYTAAKLIVGALLLRRLIGPKAAMDRVSREG
jgi:hypothetical protein